MAYSTPRTWVSGEYPTATQFNANVRDNVSFLANPPACRVYNNAAISIPNNTATALTFNTERFDTDTMHSTVTNTSRITFTTAGLYVVTGHVQWASGASSVRAVYILLGGATIIADQSQLNVNSGVEQSITTLYKFAAGNYVELIAYQVTGGALNVTAAGNYSPEFAATWIGLG